MTGQALPCTRWPKKRLPNNSSASKLQKRRPFAVASFADSQFSDAAEDGSWVSTRPDGTTAKVKRIEEAAAE
jgi:hypothetical protein